MKRRSFVTLCTGLPFVLPSVGAIEMNSKITLEATIERFGDRWTTSKLSRAPLTESQLDTTEEQLSTLLPVSYRAFMANVGSISNIDTLSVIVDGNLNIPDLQEFFSPDMVVQMTTTWRTIGLSSDLVAIAAQGAGDLFCLPSNARPGARPVDSSVWYFDHEQCEAEDLGMSFLEWLELYAKLPRKNA